MIQQKRRNSIKRRKAIFGEGIIAGAIAAQTATQAGIGAAQAAATREAAYKQAQATIQNAQQQAQSAIKAANIQSKATQEFAKTQKDISDKTNTLNKELAQQSQDFTKSENEQARDLQEQMQMNLQLAMGQQNAEQRREAARITVRNGGNIRRRIKDGGRASHSFTGELDFAIKDGDKNLANPLIPLQYTNDGGVVFMVNDKLANHGEPNGDGKKGVGIATGNNGNIPKQANLEVEGGEIFKAIPGQGIVSVISKHKLPHTNFDPKDYYLATGDYEGAFATQEVIKDKNNIPDGYNPSSKRKHTLNGGVSPQSLVNLETIYNQQPNLNTDTINGTIATLIATQNNNTGQGYNTVDGQLNQNDNSRVNVATAKYGKNMRNSIKRCKAATGIDLYGYPTIGSGTSILGGVLNYAFAKSANEDAARYMSRALAEERQWNDAAANIGAIYGIKGQNAAADALVDAGQKIYDTQIEGMTREEANRFSDALPALQTSRVSTTAPIEKIDRAARRLSRQNRRNSLSSAAAQQRDLEIESRAQEARADIYNKATEQSNEIRNRNAEIINRVQNENLNRQLMAQREYMNNKLQVDTFNAGNRIRGVEMMGSAEANRAFGIADIQTNRVNTLAGNASRQLLGTASTRANATLANATAFGNMMNTIGNSVSQGLNTISSNINNHNLAMAISTPEGRGNIATKGEADNYLASMNPNKMTDSQIAEASNYFTRFPSLKSKYPDIANKLSIG